jgi:hypothetical protein
MSNTITINGTKYTGLIWPEKNLLETALNDLINVEVTPNEGFHGMLVSHRWEASPGRMEDYIFASVYWEPSTQTWSVYQVENNFANETKTASGLERPQGVIGCVKKMQREIWGDADRKPVMDVSEGVMLRATR